MDWRPREPPLIAVGDSFVLDRWRPSDGPALRRLDLDPDTARFFGYSIEQAAAMPDSHYDGGIRMQANIRAWRAGRELNLAIRRTTDSEAVGWVEFRRAGEEAEVSYNVAAELRGQGIAPPRTQRVPHLGRDPDRSPPGLPDLPCGQRGFPAGGEKVRILLCRPIRRRVQIRTGT